MRRNLARHNHTDFDIFLSRALSKADCRPPGAARLDRADSHWRSRPNIRGVFCEILCIQNGVYCSKSISGYTASCWQGQLETRRKSSWRSINGRLRFDHRSIGVDNGHRLGLLANIVLSLYGRPIRNAVSTASGVGLIVSIPGALGYAIAGWDQTSLPPLSLGYVSAIGFVLLTPLSLLTVPYGVALAHRLEKRHLEFALAIYLIFITVNFISTML